MFFDSTLAGSALLRERRGFTWIDSAFHKEMLALVQMKCSFAICDEWCFKAYLEFLFPRGA